VCASSDAVDWPHFDVEMPNRAYRPAVLRLDEPRGSRIKSESRQGSLECDVVHRVPISRPFDTHALLTASRMDPKLVTDTGDALSRTETQIQ